MKIREINSHTLPPIFDQTRIVNTKQVAEALGFSVAHLRRLYRTGKIPKPVCIGGHKLGWPAGVIADLIASHIKGEA